MNKQVIAHDYNHYFTFFEDAPLTAELLTSEEYKKNNYKNESKDQDQKWTNNEAQQKKSQAQKKKIQKRKRGGFHYKKRKRHTKQKDLESHLPFTYEEDKKILNLVLENGPKFSDVAEHFTDRHQNTLKNRYYKFLRYHWDLVLGNDYQHLNWRKDDEKITLQNLTQLAGELNFCSEINSIMSNFFSKAQSLFSQEIINTNEL